MTLHSGADDGGADDGDPRGRGAEQHVLVLPDREAAEDVADAVTVRFPAMGEPRLVRDALAGEDDAEDAQWLVVVEGPYDLPALTWLDALVTEHEGWREET